MASFRVNRTTEDIRRELTDIMHMLKDPRITGMLTIIKVQLSNDMSHCKVYVSSLEGMEQAKEAVKGLNSAAGFIRREINQRIKMRRTPEFSFVADNSTEYSAEILEKLEQIRKEAKHDTEA